MHSLQVRLYCSTVSQPIIPVLTALHIYDLTDPHNFIRLDEIVIRSLILLYSFSTQN